MAPIPQPPEPEDFEGRVAWLLKHVAGGSKRRLCNKVLGIYRSTLLRWEREENVPRRSSRVLVNQAVERSLSRLDTVALRHAIEAFEDEEDDDACDS